MSVARVVAVDELSPAGRAGVQVGDEIITIGGEPLRDVIQYRVAVDGPEVALDLHRGGLELSIDIAKAPGEPLGIEVDAAVFDRVRTCDNHCEFCFIHQLPKGLRRTLYLKDDDYRLSFLYGNFTTLTRFTEADLERVVNEHLSPLYVSIHATDPELRAEMLRNRRGAVSLRWLRVLLDHGVQVHGQIVVCPGLNDGAALEDTMCGILDEYPELETVAVVPLGVSAHNTEVRMRPHTTAEASAVVDTVARWQDTFLEALGRRLAYAADEYYLLAGRPFPPLDHYGEVAMHEDGIGMARTFEAEFHGRRSDPTGPRAGFFAWVEGSSADGGGAESRRSLGNPTGYTVPGARPPCGAQGTSDLLRIGPRRAAPVGILTGAYGARILEPLLAGLARPDVRVITVENRFFGGNIGVAGLLVGQDLSRALAQEPPGHRYLVPDVCLSDGRFLDGTTLDNLPHPVEVVPTDGIALRAALEA